MTDTLALVEEQLLAPAEIGRGQLNQVLGRLLGPSIDLGDLYFQQTRQESWVLEDGIVKNGSHSVEKGVGVRAVSGEKTGFAYADELILPALLAASDHARAIAGHGQAGQVQAWRANTQSSLYGLADPLESMSAQAKVGLLKRIDSYARDLDSRVSRVNVVLAAVHELILIVASDGTLASDVRPLVRLNVQVIAEQNGRRETGYSGGGGRYSFDQLTTADGWQSIADEAVRQAIVNLDATEAPAGNMPVVLGPGWPGVLLHEAVGHGLEGDFNRKGISAFSGRIGEQVASSQCTVVDDSTLTGRRGSLNIDDEGTPGAYNTLIENGILRGYMQDKTNARLMGVAPTGNGRRESFAHLPMPRMTNTYMLPGQYAPEEVIGSVEKGLYAVNFAGGQVDITSGKFVFSASEAFLIEQGKITRPVKGATLIGSGPEVMTKISMVADDLELDTGIGVCGKEGQSVPVGVGQPTLKIDAITVGGTSAA